jgi:hypothetical protein
MITTVLIIVAALYVGGIGGAFPILSALFMQAPGIEWWRAIGYGLVFAVIWPYPLKKWFT